MGLPQGRVRINYDIFGPVRQPDQDEPFPFDYSKCPIGISGCTIDAYGRIVPCGYMVNMDCWIGQDVRGKDLLNHWHHSKVLEKARQVRRHGCMDCKYHILQCNGGCPVMAYVSEGDIDGRDPYCVRMMVMEIRELLLEIRNLDLYSPGEWEDYVRAFDHGQELDQFLPEGSRCASRLLDRIKAARGADAVEPDYALSPKLVRAKMLAAPKLRHGITLGVVSGCFDLLHLGHIRGISYARSFLGQYPNHKLCAMMLSDENVRAKKGPSRPILNLNERLIMLCHVRYIDYVIPLEEPDCLSALSQLRPDYFFKGAVDRSQSIVDREIDLVKAYGGTVAFFPSESVRGASTTELVETILREGAEGNDPGD